MNILLLVVILLVIFGGYGLGGAVIGHGTLGIVLLILLIVWLAGRAE